MRIVEVYSHLNGVEFLLARKDRQWDEVERVVKSIDAERCRTKESREKGREGELLYSPKDLNREFYHGFEELDWQPETTRYWVCSNPEINRKIVELSPADQKATIEAAGFEAIRSLNQTDFVKDRVAVEVQFGKYAFVAYDLFVKHMAFYVIGRIDVGIEILPMKSLQREMSSGPSYYEGELYNLVRQGRGVPAVPLVLLGVAP